MKLTTVWGVLPVISLKSKDGWGHAKGPVIWLPKGESEVITSHELFHVKQWYAENAVFVAASAVLICAKAIASIYVPFIAQNETPVIITAALIAGLSFHFWSNSKRHKFRRETAAYGESLRNMNAVHRDVQAVHYSKVLARSDRYDFDVTEGEALKRIKERFEDGRLF